MRVLTAALLMVLVFPAWAQQGTETVEPLTITVGANHAPPYRILQGGERTGLYVEIFEEIAQRLGWEVHYREAPFRRVLRMVQQGEVDVMLGPLETEERSELIEFVAPAFPPERRLFFYLNKEHRIDRYADLYGRAIGVLEGASYFPRFDDDEDLLKEPAPRYENLMLMLQKGRVDVVIAPELVGLYAVEKLGLDIEVSPFFVPGERSYIAVAKNSPVIQYADDIRAALKLIEMEGIHEDLVLKYLDRAAE
ncbi:MULTISPECIES: substrate-binding periplasmic protein [Marinobacter]|uniref:substrate-binding periplasmic protein n=1 Tax=Marinobacter TaxID=2742 RepID=UPI001B2F5F0E|nr:transporter substrate-binding domain-containing protein [Marinobacter sp.]MBO6810229.1 transporter substrate-binding domain-containing protein [Marinobacter sp.]MBO6873356.1 transporter substrate-binding domain-containing protein [Marinobacter sp.]